MARYFAEIDDNGIVLRVIVADSLEWCESHIGGTWVETSYTGEFRGEFAGPGFVYDSQADTFSRD